MAHLTIIFTTDMHNRLTADGAERLRELKKTHNAILLDGGDAVSAANVTVRPGPEPILKLMNHAGYDAMALGNREYFFRRSGMLHKTSAAKFPLLGANVEMSGSSTAIKPWIVIERGGYRVGVIGLAREMVQPGVWWGKLANARFRDWMEAAGRAVREISLDVDMLIGLSHLGKTRTRQLAQTIWDLDLILAGHDHPKEVTPEVAGYGSTIVSAPAFAREAALISTQKGSRFRPYEFQVSAVMLR